MKAIDVWNESSKSTRKKICAIVKWPAQYAEGEADSEWLTSAQLKKLKQTEVSAFWEGGEFKLNK